jgi:hypothetical protein
MSSLKSTTSQLNAIEKLLENALNANKRASDEALDRANKQAKLIEALVSKVQGIDTKLESILHKYEVEMESDTPIYLVDLKAWMTGPQELQKIMCEALPNYPFLTEAR